VASQSIDAGVIGGLIVTVLKSIDDLLGKLMRWFCITNFIVLMAMLAMVVFVRYVRIDWFTSSTAVIQWFKLSWSDEIIEWLMASLIFIAAAELWRQGDHFRIEATADMLAGTMFGKIFSLVIEIFAAAFIAAFTYYSFNLTISVGRHSQILAWPITWWYAPMPIAGSIMFIYSIRNMVQQVDELFGFGWFPTEKNE
jgi:TRAP-type C4-dicarboxylate transport system permease small subunit